MESNFRSDTFNFYSVWRGVTLLERVTNIDNSIVTTAWLSVWRRKKGESAQKRCFPPKYFRWCNQNSMGLNGKRERCEGWWHVCHRLPSSNPTTRGGLFIRIQNENVQKKNSGTCVIPHTFISDWGQHQWRWSIENSSPGVNWNVVIAS